MNNEIVQTEKHAISKLWVSVKLYLEGNSYIQMIY